MTTQTLSLGSKPKIEISNVGGDLTVEGWERTALEARSDDSPRIEQEGDKATLSCGSDLNVSVPRGASLTISYVGGDLEVENLDGTVEVSFVGVIGGETKTENVRKITMGIQGGNVSAHVSAKVQRKVDEAMRRADRKIRAAEQKMRQAHSDN